MARLAEAVGDSVGSQQGSGSDPLALERGEVERAVLKCREGLSKRFDARLGGFGGAPKFPRPCEIDLLLNATILHQVRRCVILR